MMEALAGQNACRPELCPAICVHHLLLYSMEKRLTTEPLCEQYDFVTSVRLRRIAVAGYLQAAHPGCLNGRRSVAWEFARRLTCFMSTQ